MGGRGECPMKNTILEDAQASKGMQDAPHIEPIEGKEKGASSMSTKPQRIVLAVYIVLILLGIGTGYLLSRTGIAGVGGPSVIQTDKVAGSTDTKTFKDSAEGVIEKDGAGGEGTHQLIRDGGPSQTVTLISSVVDLDLFVGKKVKVWGQTMAAKKVAWLMDVGKVELQ